MAVTTAAVIGIGSGLASSVKGFMDASAAKTAADNAETEAKAFMLDARKRAEIDQYGKLSAPMAAYEAEFEANLAADRQAIEALQEGDSRALAAGVGRVGMSQADEALKTRVAMGDEMFALDKMKADSKQNINQQLLAMDVGEAKMQDQIAREEQERRTNAMMTGFAGIGQVASGINQLAPLYGSNQSDGRAEILAGDGKIQAAATAAGIDITDSEAFYKWIISKNASGKFTRQVGRGKAADAGYSIFDTPITPPATSVPSLDVIS